MQIAYGMQYSEQQYSSICTDLATIRHCHEAGLFSRSTYPITVKVSFYNQQQLGM